MRLDISKLSEHMVTRSRGAVAFKRLKMFLRRRRSADLVIGEGQLLSLSFLDQLVWDLSKSGDLHRVIFVLSEKDTLRKLSRVANIRGVDISYADAQTGARRNVRPTSGRKPAVTTSKAKPLQELSLGGSESSS